MPRWLWALLLAGMAAWIAGMRQQLRAAQMRGDMYREIATRLDRQLSELSERGR